jgi:hypothetical protein
MNRSIRIASASALTGALYLFAALAAVLHAGEHGLGHDFNGAGMAGVVHTLFALAFVDRAWLHRGQPDDAPRQDLFQLCLLALLWGFWRVGVADHAIVPAIVGTSWVLFSATLFSPIPEDDEEHEDEAPADDALESTALDEADATID